MKNKYLSLAKQLIEIEYSIYYENFNKNQIESAMISYDEYYNIQIANYELKLKQLSGRAI